MNFKQLLEIKMKDEDLSFEDLINTEFKKLEDELAELKSTPVIAQPVDEFYMDEPVIITNSAGHRFRRYYSHYLKGVHHVFPNGSTHRCSKIGSVFETGDKIEHDPEAKPILNWIKFTPYPKGETPDHKLTKIENTDGEYLVCATNIFNWESGSKIKRWASLDE